MTITMDGSIELFQFFQKICQSIGICASHSNQKSYLTARAVFVICSAEFIISSAAFIVFEAKSLFQFGFSFCMFCVRLNALVVDRSLFYLYLVDRVQERPINSKGLWTNSVGVIGRPYRSKFNACMCFSYWTLRTQ